MSTFRKKETLVQNMSYMGLMAAINIVFVLLTTLVPVLFFLIVFVLPLTSTIVALHCNKKYFPIYAFTTIGLCFLVTLWKIDDTLFYVVPSIITGLIFALMVERKISAQWIIIATSIIQVAFTYLSIPVIKGLLGRDIINDFATVFGLKDFIYLDYLAPASIFVLALIQEILSYIIINEEIKKFGFETNEASLLTFPMMIGLATSLLLVLIFALTYRPLTYAFLLLSLYFAILLIAGLIGRKKKWIYIALIICFIITFFLFALLYKNIVVPLGLIGITIYFLFVLIIVFIDNCLSKNNNKDTI